MTRLFQDCSRTASGLSLAANFTYPVSGSAYRDVSRVATYLAYRVGCVLVSTYLERIVEVYERRIAIVSGKQRINVFSRITYNTTYYPTLRVNGVSSMLPAYCAAKVYGR